MELQDVKMAGSGTISGGQYNKVSIAGSASSSGDIIAEIIKVAGSATFNGEVEAKEVSIAGSTKFMNSVKGEKVKIAGSTKIIGNLTCEEAKIDGHVTIQGECNVGTLQYAGESSQFNNIYGENICIETKKHKKVTVNEIEATNIELKSVVAKRVSGEKVKITGRCVIDVIEFKDSLQLSKKVEVKQIVKL